MVRIEEQKNNSIQGKPKKRASLLLPVIVAAVIFVCIIISIFLSKEIVRVNVENDDFTKCFEIEDYLVKDNQLIITGWCFRLAMDTVDLNGKDVYPRQRIILMKTGGNTEEFVGLDTTSYLPRTDVNNYFKCEYDYTYCGFEAKTDANKINLSDANYEILIQFDDTVEKAFHTGVFIKNGVIEYCTYDDFDFENEYLNGIADEGVLRVYRPDVGMYVYQKDGKFFWILGNNFAFDEDGFTKIQYQLQTTQTDNLPQNMKDAGAKGDNLSFVFEEKEITENIESSKYRLCITEIPTEYSISKIKTGYHDGKTWVWEQFFRPKYEF